MIESPIAREFLETGRCASVGIVDLHAHYGPFGGIYMPTSTPEATVATMDRCGVAVTVSSGHTALADMVRGNAEICQVTARYPGRWYAYLTYNPNYPAEAQAELELYDARPSYVGLKFHPTFHSYPLTGDRYRPALEFAAERRLLVLCHTWGGDPRCDPEAVARIAAQWPGVTFLCGHSGYGEFDASIELARTMDNVYLELTAAYSVRGLIEEMVERAGEHKIVLGYDLPWFDPHYAIGCVVLAHIPESARRAILRDNAWALLQARIRA